MQWDPPALCGPSAAEWQAELERITPRSDRLSWLYLHWQPGDPWSPVERWMIYQMVPRPFLQPDLVLELEGPNPRWFGHYDVVKRQFIQSRDFAIDRTQWELYRRTGCYGRPFWVIQGPNGGHRRRYDHWEKVAITLHTGEKDPEPPAPGDLLYAEPDARLIAKLGEFDKVRAYKFALEFTERSGLHLDAEEEAELRQMREKIWRWLGHRVENVIQSESEQFWARAVDEMWDNAIAVGPDEDPMREAEAAEQQFIEEGV